MELAFHQETIKYLSEARYDQLIQELTAEMTVPETMPEMGRIVDCFGTVTVRSKEVDTGSVRVIGGIQAGVLYVPEGEETALQRIDVFLPFTVSKKLQTEENATIFYWGWIRSIDARFINARKLLVRANLGSELTVLTPAVLELSQMDRIPQGVECRNSTYPMRLPVCAVEKELQIADEVLMPEQETGADVLLKWTCGVEITDSRVIGDKAVFKGNLLLRVLFRNEAGELGAWSGSIPFSQYAELGAEPEDATAIIQPIFRHVEIDTDGQLDSHRLLLNLTLTAQILVRATVPLRLIEDAYVLNESFTPEWQSFEVMPCLDEEQKQLMAEVQLPQEAETVLDWTILPDRPALTVPGDRQGMDADLTVNLIFFDTERRLQCRTMRQVLPTTLKRTEQAECACCITPGDGAQVQARVLRIPMNVSCQTRKRCTYQTLSGGKTEQISSSEQPSLVARRAIGDLWDIAKQNASSIEAIRAVNHLDTDALTEERLLLIPTGQAALAAKEEEA